jgi:hypothetical protein
MSFFCVLWFPFFYLFKRSFAEENSGGGVWALILGCAAALVQFFTGPLVSPGAFGFARWLSALVDIIALPVIIPALAYLLLILLRSLSPQADPADFILIWLIPTAALRGITWGGQGDSALLVLLPLLWTAIALGFSFFAALMTRFSRWYVIAPSILGLLALPCLGAAVYWAFFVQKTGLGFLLLGLLALPLMVSAVLLLIKRKADML